MIICMLRIRNYIVTNTTDALYMSFDADDIGVDNHGV